MAWYDPPFSENNPGWMAELDRRLFKLGRRPTYYIRDVYADEKGYLNIQERPDGILYWDGDVEKPLNTEDANYIIKRHKLMEMDEAISKGELYFPDPGDGNRGYEALKEEQKANDRFIQNMRNKRIEQLKKQK